MVVEPCHLCQDSKCVLNLALTIKKKKKINKSEKGISNSLECQSDNKKVLQYRKQTALKI